MPMDAGEIERLIKETIPDAQVDIQDLRGDGDHYAAEYAPVVWCVSAMIFSQPNCRP